MDKSARKMLRYIRKLKFYSRPCLFKNFYNEYCQLAKCSHAEASACLRHLEENGFIRFHSNASGNQIGFLPEHKLYHARFFAIAAHWKTIRNSIVIPVVVAFVTTIITTDLWPAVKPHAARLLQPVLEMFR